MAPEDRLQPVSCFSTGCSDADPKRSFRYSTSHYGAREFFDEGDGACSPARAAGRG